MMKKQKGGLDPPLEVSTPSILSHRADYPSVTELDIPGILSCRAEYPRHTEPQN